MANVHTVDLVNRILPNVGDTISVEDYRAKLEELGYDTRHQVGSLGGASNSGVIEIKDGMVTRIKKYADQYPGVPFPAVCATGTADSHCRRAGHHILCPACGCLTPFCLKSQNIKDKYVPVHKLRMP